MYAHASIFLSCKVVVEKRYRATREREKGREMKKEECTSLEASFSTGRGQVILPANNTSNNRGRREEEREKKGEPLTFTTWRTSRWICRCICCTRVDDKNDVYWWIHCHSSKLTLSKLKWSLAKSKKANVHESEATVADKESSGGNDEQATCVQVCERVSVRSHQWNATEACTSSERKLQLQLQLTVAPLAAK